jgi:hypothetical protein
MQKARAQERETKRDSPDRPGFQTKRYSHDDAVFQGASDARQTQPFSLKKISVHGSKNHQKYIDISYAIWFNSV